MQDLHTLKKVAEFQDVGLAHGQICGGEESMKVVMSARQRSGVSEQLQRPFTVKSKEVVLVSV